MATGTLLPAPFFTAFDDAGIMAAGSLLYFFASGTSTPATIFADAALTIPLSNPVVCDSAGRAIVYLDAKSYKLVYKTAAGLTLKTVDPVGSMGLTQSGTYVVFSFGGDSTSPIVATTYPAGATFDKCHAGTAIYPLDSATLAAGTYNFQGMLLASAGTVTAALVNLSDGADATPLVTIASTSTTGASVLSSAITFAAAGASKNYGIKVQVSAGNGYAWTLQLVKTA